MHDSKTDVFFSNPCGFDTPLNWAEGVFLATHPAEPKPSSIALIKKLLDTQK